MDKQLTAQASIYDRLPVFSLICGIIGLTFFFYPPAQLILGMSAVILAYLSTIRCPLKPIAIAGIVIGILAIGISLLLFFTYMWALQYMGDPANAAMVKEIYRQTEEMLNTIMPTQPIS